MKSASEVRCSGTYLSHAVVFIQGMMNIIFPAKIYFAFPVMLFFIFLSCFSYGLTPEFQSLFSLSEKLNSPTAVAIGPQGRIYVANVHNKHVFVYTQQGQLVSTLKNLASPISAEVDANGWVFVGNERKGNVEVYDAQFYLQHKLGRRGTNDHV